MELSQTMILCPHMKDLWETGSNAKYCDNSKGTQSGWKIRKLYPKKFDCAKGNKCVSRNQELRVPKMECEFREKCAMGDNCPGSNSQYCAMKEIKGEEVIEQLQDKITRTPSGKEKDKLEHRVALIKNVITAMAPANV